MTKLFAILLLTTGLWSCDSAQRQEALDAASVLNTYIQSSFEMKNFADRENLIKHTGGTVRADLEQMTEESFRRQFIDRPQKLHRVVIRDRRQLAENRVSILYEVQMTVGSGEDPKQAAHQINKKLAFLEKSETAWLITEVRNINSTVSYKEDMSVLP